MDGLPAATRAHVTLKVGQKQVSTIHTQANRVGLHECVGCPPQQYIHRLTEQASTSVSAALPDKTYTG